MDWLVLLVNSTIWLWLVLGLITFFLSNVAVSIWGLGKMKTLTTPSWSRIEAFMHSLQIDPIAIRKILLQWHLRRVDVVSSHQIWLIQSMLNEEGKRERRCQPSATVTKKPRFELGVSPEFQSVCFNKIQLLHCLGNHWSPSWIQSLSWIPCQLV